MVSQKKQSPSDEMDSLSEPAAKKSRSNDSDDSDNAGTSKVLDGAEEDAIKAAAKGVPEIDSCELEEHAAIPMVANDDIPDWPEADLLELLKRMEKEIPQKDSLRYESRAERLNWEAICFGDYSGVQCKEMWGKIQKRLRRYRLLRELLEDGKSWVSKPWTNFYRSQKQNRHPDMPRRPLSTYMIFFMEKKDKVAQENPGLEMTGVSKIIAEMYKTLPVKKKQKYKELAARQRQQYDQKMEEFYCEHPELIPKPLPPRDHRSATETGPRKPRTPFKLFYEDQIKKHKNNPGFNRADFLEECKEQWKAMNDKKKLIWINWALQEEAKYEEQLKAYMCDNPDFVPTNIKAILTKEEQHVRERVAGKPEKPPNSGYSLFTRIMLVSPEIKMSIPKERMGQISKMWKSLNEIEKRKYQEQANRMQDRYKMEFASYLESLPEDRRIEELQNSQPKRKVVAAEVQKMVANKSKVLKKSKTGNEDKLYKEEPEPPPSNAYQLFLKCFVADTDIEKEAPQCWQTLSDVEKAEYKLQLNELKKKYIKDYEKFLKSLSQEELKHYSRWKKGIKEEKESSEDSDSDSNSCKIVNSENQKGSESDNESSDTDSDSSSSEAENVSEYSVGSSSTDSESD